MESIPCTAEGNFLCRDDISTNQVLNDQEVVTDDIESLLAACENSDWESERIQGGIIANPRKG